MISKDEVISDLVSISIDRSHEHMGRHKGILFVYPKNRTVDLTEISNYDLFPVDTKDGKYQNY